MGIVNFFKDATGINAWENRKKAKNIKEQSTTKLEQGKAEVERCRIHLNTRLESFGKRRSELLVRHLGRFLEYLKTIGKKFKEKEFEIPEGCDISSYELKEMGQIEMNAQKIMATTATSAAIASAALTGVPAAVTWGVTTFATASTGTAISTLSGAAASNAVLAWLGGGSLAAGGGGMAAGAAVLSGLTWGATGGLALLATGFISSKHFEKKLTEAIKYEAEVEKACSQMNLACDFMSQIEHRVDEMEDVTEQMSQRAGVTLNRLEPLLTDFSLVHPYTMKVFQQNAMLMKSFSELARTPILNDSGNLSETGTKVIMNSRKLLNTKLS